MSLNCTSNFIAALALVLNTSFHTRKILLWEREIVFVQGYHPEQAGRNSRCKNSFQAFNNLQDFPAHLY